MSRKILGLDIGSHSIKAVLLKEGFGKIEPVRFIEKLRINGDVQGLIRSIFQEGHLKPDIVVSSVAGNNVSVHYLKIPFSDESKIIELESLALYHAFMQWYKTEDTVALLDIGAERSNLCIVAKGKPALVRTFKRGGDTVTAAIKDACGGSMEEAYGWKLSSEINLSRVISHVAGTELNSVPNVPEDIISSAIKNGLSPLVTELLQSLQAYEINNNDEVSKLYISGGGARLRNLDQFLSLELNMDVETFRIPGEFLQKLQLQEDAGFN